MIKGIDVSKWQGDIDFKKVKNSGIEFVIIRAGTTYGIDKKFKENIEAAFKAGLKIGTYFYSYAKTVEDVKKDVILYDSYIYPYVNSITFPVCYDVEDKVMLNTGTTNVLKLINKFIEEVNNSPNLRYLGASVYTSKNYAETLGLQNTNIPLWVAQWNSKNTYKGKYYMWQYSSKGRVPGIDGNVDLDYIDESYLNQKTNDWANKTDYELADLVMQGCFGNGQDRKNALGSRYAAVQKIVNEIVNAQTQLSKRQAGHKMKLNNVALYASSTGKMVRRISGTYYIYDGLRYGLRYRITNSPENVKRTPASRYVTGYIDDKDIS